MHAQKFQLDKIFILKYFHGAPMKIYLHEHLIHEYFSIYDIHTYIYIYIYIYIYNTSDY